jgi:hypothetical protein
MLPPLLLPHVLPPSVLLLPLLLPALLPSHLLMPLLQPALLLLQPVLLARVLAHVQPLHAPVVLAPPLLHADRARQTCEQQRRRWEKAAQMVITYLLETF